MCIRGFVFIKQVYNERIYTKLEPYAREGFGCFWVGFLNTNFYITPFN